MAGIATAGIEAAPPPVPEATPGRGFEDTMATRLSRASQPGDAPHPPPEPDPAIVADIRAKLQQLMPAPTSAATPAPPAEARATRDQPPEAQQAQALQHTDQIRTEVTAVQLETRQLDQATEVHNEA